MEIIRQISALTALSGAALVGGELISYLNKNKLKDKLANGKLIGKEDIADLLGEDGIQLAKDIQLKEKYDYEGSVTFGSTGVGKSTGFFIPNLLSNNLKGSIVATDPKGELFELTSRYQQEICGRKVLRFAPLEPLYSEKYNLLTACKDTSEVLGLASSLLCNGGLSIELATGKKTGGVEWIQMAEPLLASALLYVKDMEYPYNTIEFSFKLLITLNTNELNTLFTNGSKDCIDQWNMFLMVGGADRTEGSIKITLATNMKLFTDSKINKVSSETTFNFADMREEPTILYITYPENKSSYISPFIAPFFSRMLDTFINIYSRKSLPIHIFADEFANIGMISNMSTNVSTIRSRKISMNICLQSITQLNQIYGFNNAKAILNNLKTKMIYPSISDEETLSYISKLCGEKEIEVCSRSENKSGNSKSYSKTRTRMFSESDLRCLNDDELLIVLSNKMPILGEQNTYYKDKKFTDNIKEPIGLEKHYSGSFNLRDKILDMKVKAIEQEDILDVKDDLFQ